MFGKFENWSLNAGFGYRPAASGFWHVTCLYVLYGRRRRFFPSSTDTPHVCKHTAPEHLPSEQHTNIKKADTNRLWILESSSFFFYQ